VQASEWDIQRISLMNHPCTRAGRVWSGASGLAASAVANGEAGNHGQANTPSTGLACICAYVRACANVIDQPCGEGLAYANLDYMGRAVAKHNLGVPTSLAHAADPLRGR
jgi:hypothetical protein